MSPTHRQLLPLVVIPNERHKRYDRFARRYRSYQQIPGSNSSEDNANSYTVRSFRDVRGKQQSVELNFIRSTSMKQRTLHVPNKSTDGSEETSYGPDSSTTV